MIEISKGNLIKTNAEALVNTVNCVGFMGKGIALQFKKAYPDNYQAYQKACNNGDVKPGKIFTYRSEGHLHPKYILNFPTKRHWRGNSRITDIESGLVSLIQEVRRLNIVSIAIPPLGCGLGGLNWNEVRPLIENAFKELPGVRVFLFEPGETPDPSSMPIGTKKPNMTKARALYIQLISNYGKQHYRLTLLEIQKLAYFLQEAGEQLRLRYKPALYGPYAANLMKVMERMEGHFTRGYGDTQDPEVEIKLLPDANRKAETFLKNHEESRQYLERVLLLIEGFETPYGMELLSSVHWVATHTETPAMNVEDAIAKVRGWNSRKRVLMRPEHIRVAWNRLVEDGWIQAEA